MHTSRAVELFSGRGDSVEEGNGAGPGGLARAVRLNHQTIRRGGDAADW